MVVPPHLPMCKKATDDKTLIPINLTVSQNQPSANAYRNQNYQ